MSMIKATNKQEIFMTNYLYYDGLVHQCDRMCKRFEHDERLITFYSNAKDSFKRKMYLELLENALKEKDLRNH